MTTNQTLLFGLFALILGMLLWGRVRHDLVAASGLLIGVALGVVPEHAAFSGFSNPAVIIVALVLVASRAFENSGALSLLTRWTANEKRSPGAHIAITGTIAGTLSAFINNVAALAIFMPIDIQNARKAKRPPGITLMPLAFITMLGGTITLIGTPPNIIASSIREKQLGSPYSMFDFTPVGLAVAIAGLAFVALVGWRLVPKRQDKAAAMLSPSSFEAELAVPDDSPAIGRIGAQLEEEAEKADVLIVGLIRNRIRMAQVRQMTIEPDDLLIVEGSTDSIAAFIKALQLIQTDDDSASVASNGSAGEAKAESVETKEPSAHAVVDAVVRADSYLVGRSARRLGLRPRFRVTLLGVARAGTLTRQQVRDRIIEAGDILLLSGRGAASPATLDLLGLIPINRVRVTPFSPINVALTLGLFAIAVAAASFGFLSFTVAIAMAVAAYAALGLVPAREFYTQIEWSVVVMLACLIPIAASFEQVGGTALIGQSIAALTHDHSPILGLVIMMFITMTLSDALNSVATIVVMGPVAVDLAQRLHVNPDTFLMGTAIASSCAFLTPIGHKNNSLIMAPGGFKFADYWRMGLPLEIVVIIVAVPMLLWVWPL